MEIYLRVTEASLKRYALAESEIRMSNKKTMMVMHHNII